MGEFEEGEAVGYKSKGLTFNKSQKSPGGKKGVKENAPASLNRLLAVKMILCIVSTYQSITRDVA